MIDSGALRIQEKLSIIDRIPLFVNLGTDDKISIANSGSIVEYKKGEIVYKRGDGPDAFYCIITGRLRVYIVDRGKEVDLEYLKRGRYFGILSILTGEPHSVTAQAVNDSIILKIPKGDFEKLLKRIPEIAIHLGTTLSKRLKRKDLGDKRVFESTIISVYGTSDAVGSSKYVLNLAINLKNQTGKKIIILESKRTADIAALSDIGIAGKPLYLETPFFDENVVQQSIFKHELDIDIINIPHEKQKSGYSVPLLSYLTTDYHYVIVDLPSEMDETVFELLKQSDTVHLLSCSDKDSLISTANIISDLVKYSADLSAKVKVITSEYNVSTPLAFAERRAILRHEVFATLPDSKDEYSRMIRRISRQIGECTIGLALGSGAALGLAHIGVLKVIERENIPIDMLAGTSMGALIGALWASGKSCSEIEEVVYMFRGKLKNLRLMDLTIPRTGLIKGKEVKKFLISQFGNKTFYDLKLPFKIIACDIEKREIVVLEEGNLANAVMASVAIPGFFQPVSIGGRLLVDGGIINPLPSDVLMRAGVSKIIAVNALPSPEDIQKSKKKVTNIFDIIVNSVQASEYLLAEINCQYVDIAMHPILPTADWYEFYEGPKIVKRGEEEALKYLPQLKELAAAK